MEKREAKHKQRKKLDHKIAHTFIAVTCATIRNDRKVLVQFDPMRPTPSHYNFLQSF